MDVRQRTEKLIDVELDLQYGHHGLHLVEVARSTIDGLWNVFQDKIEVDLVLLELGMLVTGNAIGEGGAATYTLAIVVKEGLQLNDVGVSDNAHDLQFSVLLPSQLRWTV